MDDQYFDICIEQMNCGDKQGLKAIYEAYAPMIYHSILAIVKNKENAEDLTSDFFIKLWQISDTYKKGNHHKSWLFTIARNMTLDFMRRSQREDVVALFENTDIEPETEKNPEQEIIGNMSFKEALLLLDPQERVIFNLRIIGQYTFKEISDFLRMPQGTVSWKYSQGLKKLRRADYGR